jgi:two-component system, NtrC family, sensor kinase
MPAEQSTLLEYGDARGGLYRPEPFTLIDVVNESIRVNKGGLHRHQVHVVRHFHALPTIWGARHKVLKILSTLITTADEYISELGRHEAKLTVRIETRCDLVCIEIETEGVVVLRGDQLNSLWPDSGRPNFDSNSRLHQCATMANELGGRLTVLAAGAGAGASYRLELPMGAKGSGNG